MRRTRLHGIAIGIGLLAMGSGAHAQGFVFSTNFNPSPVPAVGPGGTTSQVNVINGSSGGENIVGPGGNDLVLTNFWTTSNAPDGNPATVSSSYTLEVTLQQSSGGVPFGSAITDTYTGHLSGTLSTGTANVSNTFSTPLTMIYDFGGGTVYTITLNSYTPPSAPNPACPSGVGCTLGAIGAHLTGPAGPGNAPEPGSLALLLGMTVSGAALERRRRRRRQTASA
jgi:hypothetical protein